MQQAHSLIPILKSLHGLLVILGSSDSALRSFNHRSTPWRAPRWAGN